MTASVFESKVVVLSDVPYVHPYPCAACGDGLLASLTRKLGFWLRELAPQFDDGFRGAAYGISVMPNSRNDGDFVYWVAAPYVPYRDMPQGLRSMHLAGGTYMACRVPSLGELASAYAFLYQDWDGGSSRYEASLGGSCFEVYTPDFCRTGAFELYVPVVERAHA